MNEIDQRVANLIALAAEAQEHQTAANQDALNRAAVELSETLLALEGKADAVGKE